MRSNGSNSLYSTKRRVTHLAPTPVSYSAAERFAQCVVPGFRVQGPWFRVEGAGLRVEGAGFRVQGSG